MARLNDEFHLNFHEVNSDIWIEFGEDPVTLAFGEIKEKVPIPVEFEESTSRIPVNIADKEDIAALFADVVFIDGGSGPRDYYTKRETDALLSEKVDKVEGKGLSTHDLTDEILE